MTAQQIVRVKQTQTKAGSGTRWQAAFSEELTGGTNIWETPQEFFRAVDAEFAFTLDSCALSDNAKCSRFFSPTEDGLRQDWGQEVVWCNPPYGRDIEKWVAKSARSASKGATVVMLIFCRSDVKYFHEWILPYASEIRFVRGRLKFGGSGNSAPAPSVLVVFRPGARAGGVWPVCSPYDYRQKNTLFLQEALAL